MTDEILVESCVTHDGEIVNPYRSTRATPPAPGSSAAPQRRQNRQRRVADTGASTGEHTGSWSSLTIFVLAAFVGIEVISKVPSILHTPLMSGSNAIHGIILVGTIIVLGDAHGATEEILGFLAVLLATLNVVGGFVVTDRMLQMFKGRSGAGRQRPRPAASSPIRPTAAASDRQQRPRRQKGKAPMSLGDLDGPGRPDRDHRIHPRPEGTELTHVTRDGETSSVRRRRCSRSG